MSIDYIWIIGGGILQIPLIKESKKLGLNTIVSDANNKCVCANEADIFVEIDIFDIDGHIKKAQKFKESNIKISGVLAAGIDAPETMTRISEYLELNCVSSEIAHLVNHKELFREKMIEIGAPVPKFCVITKSNLDDIPNLVKDIGYPLIVKNTSSSGSRGTKIFYEENIDEIKKTALEAIEVSRSSKALIESLWEGTEHTVETIFDVDGNFHRCFITDRNFDRSDGFALETGLVHPSLKNEKEQDEMYALAETVSKNIGIKIGASKFDMIFTKNGPRIIEMTVRLSGGFDCQYVVPAATGKNILKAAILTSIGKNFDPSLLIDKRKRFCLTESLWPKPGKIYEINGLERVNSMPGFEHIFFRYQVGDTVEDYTDCTKRVCFIIVSGGSLQEARFNMKNIKSNIEIVTK